MKTIPQLVPFLAAFCLPCLLIAQESNPNPPSATSPAVDTNSPDVRDTVTYDLGNRRMIVQEVTEATLPIQLPLAPTVPTANTANKPSDDVLAARKAMFAKRRNLSFFGTAYKTALGPCRSLVTYNPPEGGQPVVFWSSIDWNLLSVGKFVSPQGLEYTLMNMVIPIDIARTAAIWASRGRIYQAPSIPAFAGGAASYKLVSGEPTPAVLSDLNAVHAFHDREYDALIAAQQTREEARRLADEAAKLPQPPPPDIIIQGRPMTPEELAAPQIQKPATITP